MKVDIKWKFVDKEKILHAFDTDEFRGLDVKTALRRKNKYGDNYIWRNKNSVLVSILTKYVFDLPVIFIIAAVLVAAFNGFSLLYAVICVISLLSVIFRFSCEFLYRNSLIQAVIAKIPEIKVLRSGEIHVLNSSAVVPGDIILLSKGDVIPCDCRIIDSDNFIISEAKLGGEKDPIKLVHDTLSNNIKNDRLSNIALAGSYVLKGRAKAVCFACGGRTYAAKNKITLVDSPKSDPESILKAEKSSTVFSAVLLSISFLYFCADMLVAKSDFSIADSFLGSFAFAASGVGIIFVSIIYLLNYLKFRDFRKIGADVCGLNFGDVDRAKKIVIVNDASTLKNGSAIVESVFLGVKMIPSKDFERAFEIKRALDYFFFANGFAPGQPIPIDSSVKSETLLLVDLYSDFYGKFYGADKESSYRANMLGFESASSVNPVNTSLVSDNGEIKCVCSGNIRTILSMCSLISNTDHETYLETSKKRELISLADSFSSMGMRVFAISEKIAPLADLSRLAILQNNMTFLGFIVVATPVLQDVPEMFDSVKKSGSGLIVFSEEEADVSLISSVGETEFEILTLSSPSDVKNAVIETDKNYIVYFPLKESASQLKYYLVKKLKKNKVFTSYISSEPDDAAALSESTCRICVRSKSEFAVIPAVISSAADILVSDKNDLPSVISKLVSSNDDLYKLTVVKKYLLISVILRFILLCVSLFVKWSALPVFFVIWGLIADQIVSLVIFCRGKS